MNEETVTDALAREFLLGKLDDAARARVEDLFLTNAGVRERVLVAEQDLIEEYLEDSLTIPDRERFVSLYTKTPEQRQKIKITELIKRVAAAERRSVQIIPAQMSVWNRLRARLRLRRALMAPIAIILLIAIAIVAVWLNSRTGRRSAIEEELVQLNAPASLREVPAQMVSLELSPVTVRSAESVAELKTSADTQLVELRLPWNQKEHYSTYQASIQRLGGGQSYVLPPLTAESNGKYVVRLRLPVHLLHRGQYQIQLSGIGPNGVAGFAEEYQFTVGN